MDRPLTAFLGRLARSPRAAACVLRGSLVTAHHVPGRRARDVDLLALDVDSLDGLHRLVDSLDTAGDALPPLTREETWLNTASPGLKLRLGGALEVDLGFGDPLAAPPVTLVVAGVPLLAVGPETMAAWKAHGIVEFGRGRFRAKDIWDLVALTERVRPFDLALFDRALALAFSSRQTPLAALDELLFDPTWGHGRSSRRKWRQLARSGLVPLPLPTLDDQVQRIRAVLTGALGRPPLPPLSAAKGG